MPQANVKATDAIESVKGALAFFGKQAADGLSEVDSEVRRTIEWIEHDRPGYWKERVRRAYDGVNAAKDELRRCMTFKSSDSHRPSCTEQQAALRKAEAHLAYCQEKQERVRHWMREVVHEMHEFQGRITSLSLVVDSDIPAAITMLNNVLRAIEEYTTGGPSGMASPNLASQAFEEDAGTNTSPNDEERLASQPPTANGPE